MIRALAMVCLLWVAAFGQTAAPAFEVASVKPVDLADYYRIGRDFLAQPGGRLEIRNLELRTIIMEAFGVKNYQVSDGPTWLDTDHFNIVAKADTNRSREEMMPMLRKLLEDRFQLRVHRETKEGNVYALVVAKNGPKLVVSTAEQPRISTHRNDPPGVSYTLTGKKASLAMIAERLGGHLGRPVMDHTGIKGEVDFKLGPFAGDDNPESGTSLFSLIQEQLGLKLETVKGPIEMLVVDHVEKPTAN